MLVDNMSVDKKHLELEIAVHKAAAYDILANIEHLEKQYRIARDQLQNQLNQVNQQIATKSELLQKINKEEKIAGPPVAEQKETKQLLTEEKK